MVNADWDGLVQGYLDTLRRRGRSPGTVRAYAYGLQDLGGFMQRQGLTPAALTAVFLSTWEDALIERGLAPRTRQLVVGAARGALRWAEDHGWEFDRPRPWQALETPKAPRLLPRPLPRADVDRISAYLARRRPRAHLTWWRTRAMWFYAVSTGARVSEMLSLDREDFDSEAPIVQQKGGSEKVLFAPPVATAAVWDYVRRREDPHPALFVTHGNPPTRRLEPAGVREQWHELADYLGIPRFTTHQLRHTCATELLDAGVPPEVVAAHLGHHGLGSLAGYGEVRRGRRQLALDAMQDRCARAKEPGQQFVVVKGGGGRRDTLSP